MQDAEPLPSPRARRGLIGLLMLLLILLPLYLWPLRGGLGGLPGGSALSGALRDPRSGAAVARIPGDVWDALMGHPAVPRPPPPPTKPSRNLTMITQGEGIPDSGLGEGTGGTLPSDNALSLVRGMLAQLGSSEISDGSPGGGESFPPAEFLASDPGGGTGTGNPPSGFTSGGYPGLGNLGPGHRGGSGGGSHSSTPGPTLHPDDPGDLAPTPEPTTLVLIGSNLALLGAATWRRRRRSGMPAPG
jgi:PEP-CTERM motif